MYCDVIVSKTRINIYDDARVSLLLRLVKQIPMDENH